MKPSKLEAKFALLWKILSGPELSTEFRFHPERQWRFDFACQVTRVAIEIEGGTWINGRHNRGSSIGKDCEKYNAAAAIGWRVFRLTGEMITAANLSAIIEVIRELGSLRF